MVPVVGTSLSEPPVVVTFVGVVGLAVAVSCVPVLVDVVLGVAVVVFVDGIVVSVVTLVGGTETVVEWVVVAVVAEGRVSCSTALSCLSCSRAKC